MDLKEALAYVADPQPFDEDKYLEAGLVLIRNRDKLSHRVFYEIPDPGALTTNRDPKWDEIKAQSTGERCNCGNCRTIWPLVWPEFEKKEDVVLGEGDCIYLVPENGNYKDTTIRVQVKRLEETMAVELVSDPFNSAINFSLLFQGPPAYDLEKLAEYFQENNKPAGFISKLPEDTGITNTDEVTFLTIEMATSTSVTIGIPKGMVVSRDPEKEFPAKHNK